MIKALLMFVVLAIFSYGAPSWDTEAEQPPKRRKRYEKRN